MARATYSAAIALGVLALGNVTEARQYLDAARAYFPSCPLLPRAEAAVAAMSHSAA